VSADTLSRKVEGIGPMKPWQPPINGKVLNPILSNWEKISRKIDVNPFCLSNKRGFLF